MQMQTDSEPKSAERPGIWFYLPFILGAVLLGFSWVYMEHGNHGTMDDPAVFSKNPAMKVSTARRDIIICYKNAPCAGQWENKPATLSGFESERDEIRMTLDRLLELNFPAKTVSSDLGMVIDQVFIDSAQTLYIQYGYLPTASGSLGALTEESFLEQISRTIQTNFPDIRSIRFLHGKHEAETLAGHIYIGDGIELRRADGRPEEGKDP